MFDDINQDKGSAPVDMFSETDADAPRVATPPGGSPPRVIPSDPAGGNQSHTSFLTRKFVIITGAIVFALALIGGGVQLYLQNATSKVAQPLIQEPAKAPSTESLTPPPAAITDEPALLPTANEPEQPAPDNSIAPTTPSEPVAPAEPLDSDSDGLLDENELLFGTNPLNPDTDGDSYKDGEEVQNGYNPLGPGKMTDDQKSKSATLNASP